MGEGGTGMRKGGSELRAEGEGLGEGWREGMRGRSAQLPPARNEGEGQKEKKVCWNYAHPGLCKFGDKCKFRHVAPSAPTGNVSGACR